MGAHTVIPIQRHDNHACMRYSELLAKLVQQRHDQCTPVGDSQGTRNSQVRKPESGDWLEIESKRGLEEDGVVVCENVRIAVGR